MATVSSLSVRPLGELLPTVRCVGGQGARCRFSSLTASRTAISSSRRIDPAIRLAAMVRLTPS